MKNLLMIMLVLIAFFSCGGGESTEAPAEEEVVVEEEPVVLFPSTVIWEGVTTRTNDGDLKKVDSLKIGDTIMTNGEIITIKNSRNENVNYHRVVQNQDGDDVDLLSWNYGSVPESVPAVVITEQLLHSDDEITEMTKRKLFPMQIVAAHTEDAKDNFVEITYFPYFNDDLDEADKNADYELGLMMNKHQSYVRNGFIYEQNISTKPNDVKAARVIFVANAIDSSTSANIQQKRAMLNAAKNFNSVFGREIDRLLRELDNAERALDSSSDAAVTTNAVILATTPGFESADEDSEMLTTFMEGTQVNIVNYVGNFYEIEAADGSTFFVLAEDVASNEQ